MVGKAEGQGCPKEGSTTPEESLWSQAYEPCGPEETVGVDEGTVGGEEEGVKAELGLGRSGLWGQA